MLNQLVHNWNRAKEARERVRQEMELERKEYLKQEWKEELIQCRANVRQLTSSINVQGSMIHSVQGNSAAETRKKRKAAKEHLEWMQRKLKEEQGMVEYYTRLLAKKVEN